MKCDIRVIEFRTDEVNDEEIETLVQCSRERHKVIETPEGRMGLCEPCHLMVINGIVATSKDKRSKSKTKLMPKDIPGALWRRRGFVVTQVFGEDRNG